MDPSAVAEVNPATHVIEAARQGFVGSVSSAETWPGLLALLVPVLTVLGALGAARNAPHGSVSEAQPRPRIAARRPAAFEELAGGRARRTSPLPTPAPARAAIPGSGTGTPASRRSSGAASSPARAPRRSWRPCLPPSERRRLPRPHDLLGPAGLAQSPALLQRRLAQLLPDRDDPAAAAGLGLEDRRRRPGAGAADRRSGRLADGPNRYPRGRRAALDRPARRVRPRRLAEVRPGLGLASQPRPASPPRPRNRRLRFDARECRDRGGPVLQTLVNTLWSLSLQSLGRPSTPAR